MVWIILAVVAALVAPSVLGLLNVFAALVLVVVGLIVLAAIGERRDRSRQRGLHDPAAHFDANRGDWVSTESTGQFPTALVDHPTGAGAPPGVDRGDDRPPPG